MTSREESAHGEPLGGSAVRRAGDAALAACCGIAAALALTAAAIVAAVIGMVFAAAALALRIGFSRRPVGSRRGGVLNARRTPDGWVAETGAVDLR